jgi:hypothetical protein
MRQEPLQASAPNQTSPCSSLVSPPESQTRDSPGARSTRGGSRSPARRDADSCVSVPLPAQRPGQIIQRVVPTGSAHAAAAACSTSPAALAIFNRCRPRQNSALRIHRVVQRDKNLALEMSFSTTSKPLLRDGVARVVQHQVAVAIAKETFSAGSTNSPAPQPAYSCGVFV